MGDILMKSNLVVMVGPPGCGKTTFIKNQPLKGNHISRDKIRFSLLEDGETYFGSIGSECCTVDCCHPTDLGFYRMAERLYSVVRSIIDRNA